MLAALFVLTCVLSADVDVLTDDVYLIPGSPNVGNMLVVDGGDAGWLLVDTGTGRDLDHLLQGLADVGATARAGDEAPTDSGDVATPEDILAAMGRVRWVVNTHWHEDHVGGNELLASRGATVVAQREGRRLMHAAEDMVGLGFEAQHVPAGGLPAVTFERNMTLRLGDQRVVLHHMPAAHTGGDTVVQLPDADVLHVGDLVEIGAWPFLDLWNGGSLAGLIAACDALLELAGDATVLVPGHGAPVGRDELAAYRDVLALLAGRAAEAVAEGLDADAFLARGVFDDIDPRWGGGQGTARFGWLIWEDARRAAAAR